MMPPLAGCSPLRGSAPAAARALRRARRNVCRGAADHAVVVGAVDEWAACDTREIRARADVWEGSHHPCDPGEGLAA